MSMETMVWIGAGTVLAFLEFFIPGLFVVFLGIAAILVGLLIHFEVIHGLAMTIPAWIALSILLIATIRRAAARYFLSDEEYRYTEEDAEAIGETVKVIQTIHASDTNGRIRFRGTDWPARSENETIKAGSHAIIKYRDNISYVVEPQTGGSQHVQK